MMKRLTIDVRMIDASGIGTYLQALCPRLIAGHGDCEFVLLGDPEKLAAYAWSRSDNVRIIPALHRIYSQGEQLTLSRLVPKNTDLFWVPHYNVPINYRGPLAVSVHDVIPLALPHLLGGLHKRLFARMLFRTIRSRAGCILTVSRFSAGEIARLAGIEPSRITTIPNGLDAESFAPVGDPIAVHSKPFILYVGNVKPHKNVRGCIGAFERIAEHFPHDLIIVGRREGFVTGDRSLEKDLGRLSERVTFTGYVNNDRLRQLLRAADVFLFPSLYEGFGLPPLEAMASGTPCVVSNAASLPEVCGSVPLYCDPTNIEDIAARLRELLEDDALRRRCRERGLEQVRRFDWDQAARATWTALGEASGQDETDRAKKVPSRVGRSFRVPAGQL